MRASTWPRNAITYGGISGALLYAGFLGYLNVSPAFMDGRFYLSVGLSMQSPCDLQRFERKRSEENKDQSFGENHESAFPPPPFTRLQRCNGSRY
jgi:hypothetical protein